MPKILTLSAYRRARTSGFGLSAAISMYPVRHERAGALGRRGRALRDFGVNLMTLPPGSLVQPAPLAQRRGRVRLSA